MHVPEQRSPVFAGKDYEIGVEQNNKMYVYILYDKDNIVERWSGDKAPIEMNKSSAFINDCCKKLGEVKVEFDGTTFTYSKDQVKDKVMGALVSVDALFNAYIENKAENDLKEKEEREIENEAYLGERFDEFGMYLLENDISLNQFLFYAAEWLAAGETKNILTGVICHLSTYFKIKPIWFFPLGKAGEGKSVIDEASVAMLPEDIFENGRITESALHRKSRIYGADYLDGKVMRMKDMGGDRDFDKWADTIDRYKELTTEGEVEVSMTGEGIDEETGERNIVDFKLKGYCSCCVTSVNSEGFDDQILSRGIDVIPVASDEQVKKFAKYNEGAVAEFRDSLIENDLGLFHDYVLYLSKYMVPNYKVINIYWECLENWFKDTQYYKRTLSVYPSLVKTITLLNADYREKVTSDDGKTYLLSTKEDNEFISHLFNPSRGLTNNATLVFNMIQRWYSGEGSITPEEDMLFEWEEYQDNGLQLRGAEYLFNISEIKRRASKNSNKYKGLPYGEIIQSLVNNGFVQVMGKMKRGNHNIYALDRWVPFENDVVYFDDKLISKYITDMAPVYRLPQHTLREFCKNDDKKFSENGLEVLKSKLELPEWSA